MSSKNNQAYELVQGAQFATLENEDTTDEGHDLAASEYPTLPGNKTRWRESGMKWVTLLLACLMLFGQYLTDDSYFYLQSQIEKDMFGYNAEQKDSPTAVNAKVRYSWIYSIYSLPNLVLPLFGGYLSDKIGVRLGNILFSTFIFIGQLICAFSKTLSGEDWSSGATYNYLLLGRFIFAMGGENLSVTQNTIVTKWFQGSYLSLALGMTTSLGKFGSVLGGWLLPSVYEAGARDLGAPFLTADMFCLIGVVTAYLLNWVDKKADEQDGKFSEVLIGDGEPVHLSDITRIPRLFWIINLSGVLNYVLLINFLQLSADLLHYRYQVPMVDVGKLTSIPYFMSIFLAPVVGVLIDKIGQRQWILLLSTCIIIVVHVMWLLFPQCPTGDKCSSVYYYVPLMFMGIFYSVFVSVIWPCVSLMLKDNILGTGIGITNALQNLGFFIFPQIIAYIQGMTQNVKGGYYWSSVFFIAVGLFALGVDIVIIRHNARFGNILGRPTSQTRNEAALRGYFVHY